jgi:Uma2 family endonuclease
MDGELIATPRPAARHAVTASVLGADLLDLFQRGRGGGPGGWWIIDEPELHFGEDVLVPDLAGWRRERMPTVPDVPAIELPPDWVCEIASPSTTRIDRTRKPILYARVKIPHFWILDPRARTLEVFRLEGAHYSLVSAHAEEDRIRAEPFEQVELEMGGWWIGSDNPEAAG